MISQTLARVSRLASAQWGLLTTAQAAQVGVTRLQLARLTDAGVLERVTHGVYATASALGDEILSVRADWLTLDPARTAEDRLADLTTAGVVSHASAASLHGLGDLLADEHTFTMPRRRQTIREGVRVYRGDLTPEQVMIVAGLPATTPARTVADLLRAGHELDHVAEIAGEALRRGMTSVDDLTAELEPLAKRHSNTGGTGLLSQMLDLVGMSPQALKRELLNTSVGRDLLASVGSSARISAGLSELISAFSPTSRQIERIASILQPPTAGALERARSSNLNERVAVARAIQKARVSEPAAADESTENE